MREIAHDLRAPRCTAAGFAERRRAHRALARLEHRLDHRRRPPQARRRPASPRPARRARRAPGPVPLTLGAGPAGRRPARTAARRTPSGPRRSAPPPARRCTAAELPRAVRAREGDLMTACPAQPSSTRSRWRGSTRSPTTRPRSPSTSRPSWPTVRLRARAVADRSAATATSAGPTRSARRRARAPRIGVREVPGGVFSGWLVHEVRPGDVIEVQAPSGSFTADLDGPATTC